MPSILSFFRVIFATFLVASVIGCSAPKPPLSFDGVDACAHAKLMLIKANEACAEDCDSFFPRISGNAQNQVMVASHAVKAACVDAESEKSKTWACAEGHSCK